MAAMTGVGRWLRCRARETAYDRAVKADAERAAALDRLQQHIVELIARAERLR